MKRCRDSELMSREEYIENEQLKAQLQYLVMQWNLGANVVRTELSMYTGIVKFCEGNNAKLRKYVQELEVALNIQDESSRKKTDVKRRIL